MKVNNASDTYDEAYVENMEKELSRKTVIPESVTAYYCANFERLAFVNFLPYFMARSVDEVCYMIGQVGMATEEDAEKFIQPFCDVIRELSADYAKYWEKKAKDNQESCFFESLRGMTNTKLKLLISESLRCNGRATIMGDTCIVTLPMPSERYSKQQIFMQLVHECTHMMTDPLIKSIRMEDGSHDIAECQVMLFDLWLFERDSEELRDAYVKWISQEVLEECEKSLSDERKNKMKEIFEKTS